ncbi:hypothetical protein B0H11DRAFT_613856 [Mycena galericulata]|nr:hypothetical protein B0H11DRAFT_613856 [Mycena galericulata]
MQTASHSEPGKYTSDGPNRNSNAPSPPPDAQKTQDQADEKARRQATKDLTQSWMDRLQLISVITTFFASTEAGMLQVTTPPGGATTSSPVSQLANSTFLGALILHIFAAIISFMGAFFLVRYNLKEAKQEQSQTDATPGPANGSRARSTPLTRPQAVWTTNPHLEEVGPFQMKPPVHLLARCHNLCILLTFAGFGLALLGILAFAWGQNPLSVGVVTSVSTALCFAGAAWVFI